MQPTLPGTNHVSHANLGKDFESALERTHHAYSIQKKAYIVRNPVEWQERHPSFALKATKGSIKGLRHWAERGDGWFLVKVPSDVDFSGVIAGSGRHIAFDAKQSKGKSIPLDNFTKHQIEKLCLAESCGAISGFMVRMIEAGRVWFLKASYVRQRADRAEFGKNLQRGEKSISISQLEENGIEIPVSQNLIDWLSVLKQT